MNWLKLLARKYKTILMLPEYERFLLVQSLWLLPIVAILLQLRGLRFTQELLARRHVYTQVSSDPIETKIWTTARMVKIAVRYNRPWANCLKKSLVLWTLLRCQGIASNLRIGVQRDATKFSAHAWVEYHGIVLNDTDDIYQQFQAFDRSFE